MGIVSASALASGGDAIGIVPYAIHVAGGEKDKSAANGSPKSPNGSLGEDSILETPVHSAHKKVCTWLLDARNIA